MGDKEIGKQYQALELNLAETKIRIRRYSLDPRLKERAGEGDDKLRVRADEAWKKWLNARDQFRALPQPPTQADLDNVERIWLELEREVDLIQRELISEKSFQGGIRTLIGLVLTLVVLGVIYLLGHTGGALAAPSDLAAKFEPWPEWGPLKYAEVAFWSAFGVLCNLLFVASYHLARRDFDVWYQPWYVSTFLRAPFLTVILMMIVLEFVEWYGEDTWMQTYLLEEGNKFYFIVFMSFCLGLASDTTAGIIRDLADGVTEFVSRAVSRVSQKLGSAVTKGDLGDK